MNKKVIQTNRAPAAIGPYNQAVVNNGVVYVSGQIALDPETGELVLGDIREETRRVFENAGAILEAAGAEFSSVLHCSIFVRDMADYPAINEVYRDFFPAETAPARALVEVSGLPKNVNIEATMMAAVVNL